MLYERRLVADNLWILTWFSKRNSKITDVIFSAYNKTENINSRNLLVCHRNRNKRFTMETISFELCMSRLLSYIFCDRHHNKIVSLTWLIAFKRQDCIDLLEHWVDKWTNFEKKCLVAKRARDDVIICCIFICHATVRFETNRIQC